MAVTEHRIHIACPPATAFRLLTSAVGLRQWWSPAVECEPLPGAVSELPVAEGRAPLRVRVDRVDPRRRVCWRCLEAGGDGSSASIEWRIEPAAAGHCTVTLTNVDAPECVGADGADDDAWSRRLEELKNAAEVRRVLDGLN